MLRIHARRAAAVAASAAVGLLAAAIAVSAPPASAAGDVTAPVIKTNAAARFLVGGVIGTSVPVYDWDGYTWDIPMQVKWTVTDNSGRICNFDVYAMAADSWPDVEYGRLLLSVRSAQPSPYSGQVADSFEDYDGDFGGSGDTDSGWKMVAEDCSGNTASVNVKSLWQTTVLQEDNRHASSNNADPGRLRYSGKWGKVSCACASWGAMRKTAAKNASFTFKRTYDRDDHVALVMAKGPGRGKANVYVDGVKVATVNTHAPAKANRVIVYDKWMPAGKHTVKVVNLATAGHPRIDLDAVLTN
jgi:hypothetical protein